MKTRWLLVASLALQGQLTGVVGAPVLSTLHSFGNASLSAANPLSELIAGSNGVFYGTTSSGGSAGQGTVFQVNPDGSGFRVLKSFGLTANDGASPVAGVIHGSDGNLYGTTSAGGSNGFGTVFRMGADGSNFSILRNFTNGDGAYPEGRLLQASDGMLYGTASGGGYNDYGVVFHMGTDGSGFQPLLLFDGANGANPEAGLIEASDGTLYGTTYSGGTSNAGTIFSLSKDGSTFSTIFSGFTNDPSAPSAGQTNGYGPLGRLIEGTNGALYGTTSAGGTNGTIFEINKDGTGYSVLRGSSLGNDGRFPVCELILASDGMLYGTTSDGGTNGGGTVFRIGQDGSNYVQVASLSVAQLPAACLLEASNGILYGTSQLGGDSGAGTIFSLQKDGSGFGVVFNFEASGGDGQSLYGRLAAASDGALYGTTRLGGAHGAGSVFSIARSGRGYRVVTSLNASNSGPTAPLSSLVEGPNGALYGDTQFGGIGNNGTIFSVNKNGSGFGVLYDASSSAREPRAGLLLGSDGALYGAMAVNSIFHLNTDGSGYTNLHLFSSATPGPGDNPMQALIEGSDHALYGTAFSGGASNNGSIFRCNKDGTGFTNLYSFRLPPDGANPMSPLLQASDGALYGLTYAGGSNNNAGTVFRINTNGTGYQILYCFEGTNGDGRLPSGALVEGTNGAIYGTTERGGASDEGTLFTLNKNGSDYAQLVSFGGAPGQNPRGGLTLGQDGALYGTTDQGGVMGFGTVFRYGTALEEISSLQFIDGYIDLACVGTPGTNYFIERTAQLGPSTSWSILSSTNAPASGQFDVLDQNPPATAAFYRMFR